MRSGVVVDWRQIAAVPRQGVSDEHNGVVEQVTKKLG